MFAIAYEWHDVECVELVVVMLYCDLIVHVCFVAWHQFFVGFFFVELDVDLGSAHVSVELLFDE